MEKIRDFERVKLFAAPIANRQGISGGGKLTAAEEEEEEEVVVSERRRGGGKVGISLGALKSVDAKVAN